MTDIVKILNVEEFGALNEDGKIEYLVAIESLGQRETAPVVELGEFLRSGIMKTEWEAHNTSVEAKVSHPYFLATAASLTDAVWATVMGDAEPKLLADVEVGEKTASGDDKGEIQSISSNEVGDLAAVLGVGTDVTSTSAPVPAPVPEAPAAAPAPIDPPATGVSTSQLKTIQPAPAKTVAKAAPQPAPEPVKTVQPGVVVKATAAPTNDQLPEVAAAMQVGSMQTQSALNQILEYMRDMHPAKPQSAASIEQNQVKLMYALYTVMINEDANFATVWKAVTAIARANRDGAFKVTARNRGLNTVSLATIDNKMMRFLTRVIDLLAVTSGLNDMSTLRQHVDFEKLLETVTHNKAKQNLTAFYSA